MRKVDRILFAAGVAFIGGYFLLLARYIPYTFFSPDDMMNLYRAWANPLGSLIKGNVLFFLYSPYYRPLAEAWYRTVYFFAGFSPQPFKVSYMLFLVANIFLTYCVVSRLSRSRATGAMAALLISYHGHFAMVYTDTGFIYDVLCYFFYFSTLVWYLRIRQQGRFPRWSELTGCAVLYACALNSKEIAVSLPCFVLAYELLYEGKPEGRLVPRRWWTVLITGTMTAMFIAGRILSADSLMQISAYRPVFTWQRFMETSVQFANELFYAGDWFTSPKLLLLWVALLAYAIAARSRTLQFGWLFLMIAPLPIAFLLPREAPQYYVPSFGWTLYAAAFVWEGVDLLIQQLPTARRPYAIRAAGVVLVAGIALFRYPIEKNYGLQVVPSESIEGEVLRSATKQLRVLHPTLPPRTRLYFLDDPTPADWNLFFLVRLNYRDATLVVDPTHRGQQRPPDAVLATYDHVFDYRAGHLTELTRPWQRGLSPAVAIDEGRPQVMHSDFSPVTPEHPAVQSESLITRAFDLGDTDPPVAPGEKFPRSPLARVVAPVEIRVNGRRVEPGDTLGWPAEVNRYRVDFRLPRDTPPGTAQVTLGVNGITGPPVAFPVRAYVENARRRAPAPGIVTEAGRPQVFHRDWQPVTREVPAGPGEDLITKAVDLGETRPAVPPGTPFPANPLVNIVAKVEAKVNGVSADTSTKVGWPNEINRYRVDIRIPEKTSSGMAKLTLRVNGASGPAVEIPVR